MQEAYQFAHEFLVKIDIHDGVTAASKFACEALLTSQPLELGADCLLRIKRCNHPPCRRVA